MLVSWTLVLGKPDLPSVPSRSIVTQPKPVRVAPQHWPLEVSNRIFMAERRLRLNAAGRQRMAGLLHDLPVALDPETTSQVWTATAHLADRFRLTIDDTAYLELAQRRNLPLASLDRQLAGAGFAIGVTVLGVD